MTLVKGIDSDLVFLVHKLLFKLVFNNSNIKTIGYQIVFEHIMLSHEKQRENLNKSWTSRASGRQTERADCRYLKN